MAVTVNVGYGSLGEVCVARAEAAYCPKVRWTNCVCRPVVLRSSYDVLKVISHQ